jgi:hypothetical protein
MIHHISMQTKGHSICFINIKFSVNIKLKKKIKITLTEILLKVALNTIIRNFIKRQCDEIYGLEKCIRVFLMMNHNNL